jgi:hypothetical protein
MTTAQTSVPFGLVNSKKKKKTTAQTTDRLHWEIVGN